MQQRAIFIVRFSKRNASEEEYTEMPAPERPVT